MPRARTSALSAGYTTVPTSRRMSSAYARTITCASSSALNNWGVYSISTSGGTKRRLATGIYASWSPTQDLLAFVDPYNKRTRSQGLYIVRPGSRPRLLLQGGDVEIPVWSPDGRRIAIQRSHAVDERLELLLVVDVRTRTRRLAATTPSSSWPSWSPDGRWIAVSMQPSGEIPLRPGRSACFAAIPVQLERCGQTSTPSAWPATSAPRDSRPTGRHLSRRLPLAA